MSAPCYFLVMDKPAGLSSFAVVARVRRIAGTRRVGHLGTLDPMATGVLPIAVGNATRLIEHVEGNKRYLAEITLGRRTDTDDAEGTVVETREVGTISQEAVREALATILRSPTQVPPMASALHHEGRRLYELFRAGHVVAVPPRPVCIDALDIVQMDVPRIVVDVQCGPGTYVRSIARDLGELLGCGAHLSALRRTGHGPFRIDQAVSCEQLESDGVSAHVRDPRAVLHNLSWVTLSAQQASTIRNGGRIPLEGVEAQLEITPGREQAPVAGADPDVPYALASPAGDLLAIAILRAGALHPRKVFQEPPGGLP